jgi:hypothetical protein
MTNKKQLGKTLIKMMKNLSTNQIKRSILTSFMVYKQCTFDDASMPTSQWFHFHDLIALKWGYYGDHDLHIDKMEERWTKTVKGFKSRTDIEKFVQSVGDFKESHDEYLAKLGALYNNIIIY